MWAFEDQGVVPDIVVMGKPIGNGHPMAAVFTTPEISSSFEDMEFFSTFVEIQFHVQLDYLFWM